jgi:hypothetical protein
MLTSSFSCGGPHLAAVAAYRIDCRSELSRAGESGGMAAALQIAPRFQHACSARRCGTDDLRFAARGTFEFVR